MMVDIGIIGWTIISIGLILLLIEAYNPGFFLAVPGTTLIILGIIALVFPAIFESQMIIIIGIIMVVISTGISIWIYSRLTPEGSIPLTMSKDSLEGKTGLVRETVNPDSISGKVLIDNVEWSAKSEDRIIQKGKKIRVTSSEGVHVTVTEED
ncbi:MAG: NfeD family protein [Methanomicrobiaceae archaeon]|nr:NfeD family protein [Methanomicrobiaceae archaeon]